MKKCLFNETNDLFILNCKPIITPTNRNFLIASRPSCFTTVQSMDLNILEICLS